MICAAGGSGMSLSAPRISVDRLARRDRHDLLPGVAERFVLLHFRPPVALGDRAGVLAEPRHRHIDMCIGRDEFERVLGIGGTGGQGGGYETSRDQQQASACSRTTQSEEASHHLKCSEIDSGVGQVKRQVACPFSSDSIRAGLTRRLKSLPSSILRSCQASADHVERCGASAAA